MKKFLLVAFFLFTSIFSSFAEENVVVTSFANSSYIQSTAFKEKARLYQVKLTDFVTYVTIEVVPTADLAELHVWTSEQTCVVSERAVLPLIGAYNEAQDEYFSCKYDDKMGWQNVKAGEPHYYVLAFSGRIPEGDTSFSLIDDAKESRGYSFKNRKINNPKTSSNVTEEMCKKAINESNDGICGIYEEVGGNKNRLACVNIDGTYALIYLGCGNNKPWWFEGDFKALLKPSATPGLFKASWILENKLHDNEAYVAFDELGMRTIVSLEEPKESNFLKMYPVAGSGGASVGGNSQSAQQSKSWSGTGFALYNNYVATNYHVVQDAKSIYVHGVKGDFSRKYKAVVVATDKVNDLAILKVEGADIPNLSIPYSINTSTIDVGEKIFVLGYPMRQLMGDDIKLTEGIINSKTGYMGDVSLYQISASLQGGNSGGPVFNSKGDVVAIAVAHLDRSRTNTENVNYAIKASYLRNLMESAISENILPQINLISKFDLPKQVKAIQNCVYYITCSSVEKPVAYQAMQPKPYVSDTRVVYNPQCAENSSNQLHVASVTMSSKETILTLIYTSDGSNERLSMNKDAILEANGYRHRLIKAEGIATYPNVTSTRYRGEKITIKLYFPAISKDSSYINFIESSMGSEWSGWVIKKISLK